MKASFLDLRRHMKDVLRAMDRNEEVTLTYRGKPRGVIQPVKKNGVKAIITHPAFGIWKNRDDMEQVDHVIDRLRKGRSHAV